MADVLQRMIFELKVTLTKEAALSSKMKQKKNRSTEQCKNPQDHHLKLCTFAQIKHKGRLLVLF